jgi:hypothetical protein
MKRCPGDKQKTDLEGEQTQRLANEHSRCLYERMVKLFTARHANATSAVVVADPCNVV